MTHEQKAAILGKLDELRDAVPMRSTYPEDTETSRLSARSGRWWRR